MSASSLPYRNTLISWLSGGSALHLRDSPCVQLPGILFTVNVFLYDNHLVKHTRLPLQSCSCQFRMKLDEPSGSPWLFVSVNSDWKYVSLNSNHLVKHTGALVYRLLLTSLFYVVRDPHSYTHNMFH
jgi:hypothetical protein